MKPTSEAKNASSNLPSIAKKRKKNKKTNQAKTARQQPSVGALQKLGLKVYTAKKAQNDLPSLFTNQEKRIKHSVKTLSKNPLLRTPTDDNDTKEEEKNRQPGKVQVSSSTNVEFKVPRGIRKLLQQKAVNKKKNKKKKSERNEKQKPQFNKLQTDVLAELHRLKELQERGEFSDSSEDMELSDEEQNANPQPNIAKPKIKKFDNEPDSSSESDSET